MVGRVISEEWASSVRLFIDVKGGGGGVVDVGCLVLLALCCMVDFFGWVSWHGLRVVAPQVGKSWQILLTLM